MNAILPRRVLFGLMAIALLLGSVSCTTTYDNYGRPKQKVDPVKVAVGALVVGALAVAIKNTDKNDWRDEDHCCDRYRYHDYGDCHRWR